MHDDWRPPVLIGYDGYEEAAAAINRAGALLAPRRAFVAYVWESLAALLLHQQVDSLTGTMREAAEEFDAGEDARARELCDRGAKLAEAAGFDAQAISAQGKPKAWPTLLRLADEHRACAIVVGSEGLGAVRSALLGSVSGGLLHHSRLPVLIVPSQPAGPGDGPVVMAYDGSAHSRRGIEAAAGVLGSRKAIVQTVWSSYEAVMSAGAIGVPAAVAASSVERMDEELARKATERAEEGAAIARSAGFDAAAEALRQGRSISGTLIDSAVEHDAAVLVAGSRGHSALHEVLLGSVAAGLAHKSEVPVLVVPDRS